MPRKNQPITLTAKVVRVVRSGKDMANVTLEVPTISAAQVPIGEVKISIEMVQKEMVFGKPYPDDDDEK